jgi:hypothetical protein
MTTPGPLSANVPSSTSGFYPGLPDPVRFNLQGIAAEVEIAWYEHPPVPQVARQEYADSRTAHRKSLVDPVAYLPPYNRPVYDPFTL